MQRENQDGQAFVLRANLFDQFDPIGAFDGDIDDRQIRVDSAQIVQRPGGRGGFAADGKARLALDERSESLAKDWGGLRRGRVSWQPFLQKRSWSWHSQVRRAKDAVQPGARSKGCAERSLRRKVRNPSIFRMPPRPPLTRVSVNWSGFGPRFELGSKTAARV